MGVQLILEVERAIKLAGSSEPSQSLTNISRARASRAKALSKFFEHERAEPKPDVIYFESSRAELWLEPTSQKTSRLDPKIFYQTSRTSQTRQSKRAISEISLNRVLRRETQLTGFAILRLSRQCVKLVTRPTKSIIALEPLAPQECIVPFQNPYFMPDLQD